MWLIEVPEGETIKYLNYIWNKRVIQMRWVVCMEISWEYFKKQLELTCYYSILYIVGDFVMMKNEC